MASKRNHASESDSGRQGVVSYPKIGPIQSIISAGKSRHREDDVAGESSSQQALAAYKPPQVNSDDSGSDSSLRAQSEEHEQAVVDYKRMLQKHADTLYGHLGLQSTATAKDVKSAHKKWAFKLHPDQNKSKDAREWYAKVQKAYLTLGDEEKRSRYDAKQQKRGMGVSFEEGRSAPSESDSELDNENIPPPRAEVTKALKRIADDVAICLLSDDQEERRLAKEKIREANRKVQASNTTSGVKNDAYIFRRKSPELLALAQDFRRVRAWLKAGNVRLASELGRSLVKNFDDFRERPQNQWPQSWTDSVTAAIAAAHESRGHSFSVLPPKKDLAKVERPRTYDSDFDSGPASDLESADDVAMTDVGQLLPQDERYWAIGPDSLTLQVKPGFTEGGRRILGYRAWYPVGLWRKGAKFDPETAEPSRMQFIIQGFGRRIELVASSSLGESVKYAYLDQKPSRKNFVPNRREEIHANIPAPAKVKDYACYHSVRPSLPDGVALCEAQDGKEFLISRAILRIIMGKDDADTFIYVHLLHAGKPIPFDDARMRQKLGLELRRPRYLEGRPRQRSQKLLKDVSSDSGIYDSSSDDDYGGRNKAGGGFRALIEGFQDRLHI
ncbi:hypothetical protein B0T11DRAFT_336152 [Plectosphaerella cucumerina]|uniref:J domain-containing protein n=1 Tax=Plectosphaerella cucumerina TaxID=40658 RepID=A0A8K0X9R4_9PEZI|nr:hypothetical protein B0T11DRAFT_336152 [Plectosphaerella cucumerina]